MGNGRRKEERKGQYVMTELTGPFAATLGWRMEKLTSERGREEKNSFCVEIHDFKLEMELPLSVMAVTRINSTFYLPSSSMPCFSLFMGSQ